MPQTEVISLMNDNLILFIRSWTDSSIVSKISDEINHFLTSAEADIEVTTPFEYFEHQSSVANKVRISLSLANDLIYNVENKDTYQHAAEIAIVYKTKNEMVIGAVGHFEATLESSLGQKVCVFNTGMSYQGLVPIPKNLLGLHKSLTLNLESIQWNKFSKLILTSNYNHSESVWSSEITDF